MIITVSQAKGGVAKSTTAMHLAAWLNDHAPTMLIDADPNRSAMRWAGVRGDLPFPVVDARLTHLHRGQYAHTVIDTEASIKIEDLTVLAAGCDLLVLPTTPDALSIGALFETISVLRDIAKARFRVLLTIIPPPPSKDEQTARDVLAQMSVPTFRTAIPRLVEIKRASELGQIVRDVKGENAARGWEAHAAFAQEVQEVLQNG